MAISNEHYNVGLTTPGRKVHAVVPHDTNRLPFTALTLYVTVGGTINYTTVSGDNVTQTVPNYYEIPLQVVLVKATGTTATGVIAYG